MSNIWNVNVLRLLTRCSFLHIFIEFFFLLKNTCSRTVERRCNYIYKYFFLLIFELFPLLKRERKRGQWMEKTEREREREEAKEGEETKKEKERIKEMIENSLISCFNTQHIQQLHIYTYVHATFLKPSPFS